MSEGGKYRPLTTFLCGCKGERVTMTFADVERVLGFRLPRSARAYRSIWSNNRLNSVMTQAWRAAGFVSERVDMLTETVVFCRADHAAEAPPQRAQRSLYGWLEGTVRVAPGVDLTERLAVTLGEDLAGPARTNGS